MPALAIKKLTIPKQNLRLLRAVSISSIREGDIRVMEADQKSKIENLKSYPEHCAMIPLT